MMSLRFRLSLVLGLVSALGLSACGKSGPYSFELTAKQPFALSSGAATVAFEPNQTVTGVATLSSFGKKLTVELGGQMFAFKGAKLNATRGSLIVRPADSGVRTTGGELLGVSAQSTLICNPDCETVEHRTEQQACTYQQESSWYNCHDRYDPAVNCSHEYRNYPRQGVQTVEREIRTRKYDLTGTIFGATSGEMAGVHASFSTVDDQIIRYGTCY